MRRLLLAAVLSLVAVRAGAETITVSAAISLKESLGDIRKSYESSCGDRVTFNFDASGKLRVQIEEGAPVDLFISADDQQMDKLAKANRIDTDTRRVVVDNTLVLIAGPDEKQPPRNFADLAVDHGRKIAIGEPRTVPAGRYAMQTLQARKLDRAVVPRLVYGESVREVLSFVEQDAVYAGIVYGTDAKEAGKKVKIVATADAATHDAVEYPGAVVAGCTHATAARRFLDYLSTAPARELFIARGFSIPQAKPPATQKTP